MSKKLFIIMIILSAISYALPGVTYDISNSINNVVGSATITAMSADPVHSIIYVGTDDGKFGYYNETSNTSVDLTPIVSGWTNGYIISMTLDTLNNRLYLTSGQIPNTIGYYNLSTNTSVQLGFAWTYLTIIKYDDNRNVIWYGSNDNEFGYINPVNGSKVYLQPSGGWVYALCIDQYYDRVYIGYAQSTKQPEYYDINNDTKVTLNALPLDVASCDMDNIHNILYVGSSPFLNSGYYYPENDSFHSVYSVGDMVWGLATKYIQYTKSVAFIDTSYSSNMYNISTNTFTYFWDTDADGWLDPYYMFTGDYNNVSRRLYIGLSSGGFGYFDNNYSCAEDWIANYSICYPNSTKFLTYYDLNSCGTYNNVPIDNGTYVNCSYICGGEDWIQHVTNCTTNDTYTLYYIDIHYCGTYVYLPADNGTNKTCNFYTSFMLFDIINRLDKINASINSLPRCNCSAISANVWNYTNRTLTYVDYDVFSSSIWGYPVRNLTYYPPTNITYSKFSQYLWNWTGRYVNGIII